MEHANSNPRFLRSFRLQFGEHGQDDVEANGEQPKKYQYYIVKHDDGEEEVSIETGGRSPSGWVSLGSFYFSKGDTKVTLSDKGSEPRQFIIADAIKWVYTSNNK